LAEINQLNSIQTQSATDVKRIEFTTKVSIIKPFANQVSEEDSNDAYRKSWNGERHAPDYIVSPVDRINNDARKQ
jgi:hypothetical protein